MRALTAALTLGLAAALCVDSGGAEAQSARRANFEHENASVAARKVADWVVYSNDSHGLPFVIVEKTDAMVYVFNADGRLRGAAPALLGLAHGDTSAPGIGERDISTILPEERTTPAGRYVASLDHNLHGGEILWVDYENAISLHPVITTDPKERRAQRLMSPSPLEHRISYGCINVPVGFFHLVIHSVFARSSGVVYVLPEVRSIRDIFSFDDVDESAR
jgi:hypothetical protein